MINAWHYGGRDTLTIPITPMPKEGILNTAQSQPVEHEKTLKAMPTGLLQLLRIGKQK